MPPITGYLGCFKDTAARMLKSSKNFPQNFKPSVCLAHCKDKGKTHMNWVPIEMPYYRFLSCLLMMSCLHV